MLALALVENTEWNAAEVLSLYRNLELERLVRLLETLIPDSDEAAA